MLLALILALLVVLVACTVAGGLVWRARRRRPEPGEYVVRETTHY